MIRMDTQMISDLFMIFNVSGDGSMSKQEFVFCWNGWIKKVSSISKLIYDMDGSCIIECEGLRRHSSLIFLILLFTKPNIEVSGWLYQTKIHFTHIVYQPFSRMSPPSFTLSGQFYLYLLEIKRD